MMRTMNDKAGVALGAALLAMMSAGPVAAVQVFQGLDNAFLAGGGGHPNADAARASFNAAAGVLLVQTFDELANGPAPGVLTAPFGATLSGTATSNAAIASSVGPFDTFPTAGKFLDAVVANGNPYYTFTFDLPTRAVGFDITDASDWLNEQRPTANLVVSLLTSTGNVELTMFAGTSPASIVNGNFGFFGVVSDAQDILGFSIINPLSNPDSDAIGIDNLAVSIEPVPLPGAAWMLLPALAGIAGITRRRRPAKA